jgi:hypothetical protein
LPTDRQGEVYIDIPKDTDVNSLQRLKSLLTENLGEKTVFLAFENGKKISLPFKIEWNENLAGKINEILENKSS